MRKLNTTLVTALIALAAVLSSVGHSAHAANTAQSGKKDIGIQLYSVGRDISKNPEETIEKLSKMGYTFVETHGYKGQFYKMEPAAFKALLEKHGMRIGGSHIGGLNLPKDGDMTEALGAWDKIIADHKAIGAQWLVKPSMPKEAYQSLEVLKQYCDYFNAIGEKCKAAGIRFGYHNHADEFKTKLDGHTVYDFMLENTDPDKVMFEIDLFWLMKGGKTIDEYVSKYPGRFYLYHLRDARVIGESGTVDFKTAFDMADKAGMAYYIVEIPPRSPDVMDAAQKSSDYLNNADFVTK